MADSEQVVTVDTGHIVFPSGGNRTVWEGVLTPKKGIDLGLRRRPKRLRIELAIAIDDDSESEAEPGKDKSYLILILYVL